MHKISFLKRLLEANEHRTLYIKFPDSGKLYKLSYSYMMLKDEKDEASALILQAQKVDRTITQNTDFSLN